MNLSCIWPEYKHEHVIAITLAHRVGTLAQRAVSPVTSGHCPLLGTWQKLTARLANAVVQVLAGFDGIDPSVQAL